MRVAGQPRPWRSSRELLLATGLSILTTLIQPHFGNYGKVQWVLQYSRTERKAYNGSGVLDFAPVAEDDIIFASLRYCPF